MSDHYSDGPLRWLGSNIGYVVEQLGDKCESPIELGMLKAFAALRLADRRIKLDGLEVGPLITDWDATIYRQHKVASYRLDFAACINVGGSTPVWLGIECDGHDFHERTKEQAARDKARDRELTGLGYRLLRFTGSEIYHDNMGCARQVHALITKIAGEMGG